MPGPPRDTLSPHELRNLLERLDEVMVEAHKLRDEVSRQLTERNSGLQPRIGTSRSSDGEFARARRRVKE